MKLPIALYLDWKELIPRDAQQALQQRGGSLLASIQENFPALDHSRSPAELLILLLAFLQATPAVKLCFPFRGFFHDRAHFLFIEP